MFNATLNPLDYGNIASSQLDISLNTPDSHFRLLHHILIAKYAKVTLHHRDTPIALVGLDIETNHLTGEPKLLGFSYPDGLYEPDVSPSLESLFYACKGIIENCERGTQLATWGSLDINCVIRLFRPTEQEQKYIRSGYGGKYRNGEWITPPPLHRYMSPTSEFCIDHYIPGRSLRLCIVEGGRSRTLWIYNISQFFPARIADTAKALEFKWRDFGEDTHLIDWERFGEDSDFKMEVLLSNKQDAETVRLMGIHLQKNFYQAIGAYPSLLVSTGSLSDAAASKLMTREDYESNSWQYLKYSTFGNDDPVVNLAENLVSEAYSAGYVDQFSIGYHPTAYMADISSAYPHKIRMLPDLRECYFVAGFGPLPDMSDMDVFTVVFRGMVTIPEHLEYHPITVRTSQRQNIRPLGTFRAAYYLEERDFCEAHGATFDNEEWVIFALRTRKPAPIAAVSMTLADMRDRYREQQRNATTNSETAYFDSLQETVKVVDNSLYGKNVMAVELVDVIDGKPTITGYKAGDRFNMLYGGWITALTRTQIASACMALQEAGSKPLLAMTDAIYWTGDIKHLPVERISFHGKQAGQFEPPETVHDFFLVKTGQYEYSKPDKKSPTGKKFSHKMRGLNLPYEDLSDYESFYRSTIREWLEKQSPYVPHPEDVQIPVNTRKLVTIGMHNLENLGMVSDGVALMKPFVLSGKQVERFVWEYRKTLDGAVRLRPAVAQQSTDKDSPLEFLSGLNQNGGDYLTRHERKRIFYLLIFKITGMCLRNRFHGQMPDSKRRLTDISWSELEEWSGIKREWAQL